MSQLTDIRPNPISPLRDRVSVLEAMGGRKTATPFYLAISLAFFLFIAGAIMLGIGITKTVESSCSDDQKNEKLKSEPQLIHRSQRNISFDDEYHPCNNGNIILAFDNSNELSSDYFYQEINFLITMLFDDNWNHVERLTLIEYNSQAVLHSFDANQTVDDVREVLGDVPSSKHSPKLIEVLKAVNDLHVVPSTSTSHLIIFASFIDQNVVDECNSTVQTLSDKNVTITFVSLGDQLDESLFFQLSPNLIVWDLNQKAPTQWNSEFSSAYGCESFASSTFSPTKPEDFPCLGSIILAFDTSDTLTASEFKRQIDFLTKSVFTSAWTKLERLSLIAYKNFADVQPYSTFQTVYDVYDFLSTNQQSASDPRLCRLFATIDHEDLVSTHAPAHALIFVSEITSSDVDNCRNYVLDLQNKGLTITFVTLGTNVNTKLLIQLSPNLIKWAIETDKKPALWDQLFWSAYGCAGNPPSSAFIHS
ncbi:hypothetical protein M3Y94_00862400 [Aphelenchoides besseyi]|nr:hypothetical protein M3Y94_00862400 [Aphelenchoides besseyi]KAI6226736.1 hypothetical protein M3Y95_00652200 [Aphelenchoides besseyi]